MCGGVATVRNRYLPTDSRAEKTKRIVT